jgi:hypothetical protein
VIVTDSASCSNISSGFDFLFTTTEGVSSENDVIVFPNPVASTLGIQTHKGQSGVFRIINLMGEEILTGKFNQSGISVDVSSFTPGVYLLILEMDSQRITKKIVRQ